MTASVIATRASELALRQARQVQPALEARGVASPSSRRIKTSGDKRLDEPLSAIGGKGLFTKELETRSREGQGRLLRALAQGSSHGNAGRARVVAMLQREDPRDVLIVNDRVGAESLDELPRGIRVGTSSLRRRAQLLAPRARSRGRGAARQRADAAARRSTRDRCTPRFSPRRASTGSACQQRIDA